jgi:hypothetical protein
MKPILITLHHLLSLIRISLPQCKVRNGRKSTLRKIRQGGQRKRKSKRKLQYRRPKKLWKSKNKQVLNKIKKSLHWMIRKLKKSNKNLKPNKNLNLKPNRHKNNNKLRKSLLYSKITKKQNCTKKAMNNFNSKTKRVRLKLKSSKRNSQKSKRKWATFK